MVVERSIEIVVVHERWNRIASNVDNLRSVRPLVKNNLMRHPEQLRHTINRTAVDLPAR